MTGLWAWIVGIVAAVAATLFATADSALLAFHASEASAVSDAAFIDRERRHRALAMGRVLAYIAAGASFAQALHLALFAPVPRMAVMALTATVLCAIAEGVGRAVGYSDP